jgi:hypothetical protein
MNTVIFCTTFILSGITDCAVHTEIKSPNIYIYIEEAEEIVIIH